MNEKRPQIIVLTPVRNEAWVLRAFLSATSLWADHIIIADQMSTDGSREIYTHYPKVTVVDNARNEMHQAATRRLLFEKARELLGSSTDAVLFALDADEFLSGDFQNTEAWCSILNSKPNDCFFWSWMNLTPDGGHYTTHVPYYWAVHVSQGLWEGEFPDNFIHEWRLPWPPCESNTIYIDQFYSIHFGGVNVVRNNNKSIFYQVTSLATAESNYNFLSIYRMYYNVSPEEKKKHYNVPADAYSFYEAHNIDLWKLINLNDVGQYYVDEVERFIKRDGTKHYALLNIWDAGFCAQIGVENPQRWYHKLILRLLKYTGEHRNVITKGVDKIVKVFFRCYKKAVSYRKSAKV